jgi:hypothetical protein
VGQDLVARILGNDRGWADHLSDCAVVARLADELLECVHDVSLNRQMPTHQLSDIRPVERHGTL